MGTVELKMSDSEFWNCTHKKLLALLEVHKKLIKEKYKTSDESRNVEEEYIDNINL